MTAPTHRPGAGLDDREALAEEIARLELLRRLALGAAHTLNNAFTAILGETLCLADERKSDSVVTEACGLIQTEVERCARLTRSIAMRVQPRESALEEADLAALVRGLEPLLRETVSRSVSIALEIPDARVLVRGPGEDLELIVLLIAHRLARASGRGASLRIALGPHDATSAELNFELRNPGAAPLRRDDDDASWNAVVADAAVVLACRHGVRVTTTDGEGSCCASLRFETATPTF